MIDSLLWMLRVGVGRRPYKYVRATPANFGLKVVNMLLLISHCATGL